MFTYYATVPASAVKSMMDGHQYAYTTAKMYGLPNGLRHVTEYGAARLMRVSYMKDNVAYIKLGTAGDAIACTTNLPLGVIACQEEICAA